MRELLAAIVYGVTLGHTTAIGVATGTEADAIFAAVDRRLVPASAREHGRHYHWKRGGCDKAPGGCHARLGSIARYMVEASIEVDVSPWVLASVAFRETWWNPWAKGDRSEAGVMQLARGNRKDETGRMLDFYNPRHKQRCAQEVGECQQGVVRKGAQIIRRGIDKCGSLRLGLYYYNSGRCDVHPNGYGDKVLADAERLRGGGDV